MILDEAAAAIFIFLFTQVVYNVRKITVLEGRLARIEERIEKIERYLWLNNELNNSKKIYK